MPFFRRNVRDHESCSQYLACSRTAYIRLETIVGKEVKFRRYSFRFFPLLWYFIDTKYKYPIYSLQTVCCRSWWTTVSLMLFLRSFGAVFIFSETSLLGPRTQNITILTAVSTSISKRIPLFTSTLILFSPCWSAVRII